MRLLLDAAVFLWWVTASECVPEAVRTAVSAPANEVSVSADMRRLFRETSLKQ